MSLGLARALVFFASAAVLVVELLATRLLAPYLGVSLLVFTGVIAVILGGISLGAWLGGRAADRQDPRSLLGPILVAGGLTAMLSPLVVDLIGPGLGNDPISVIFASLVAFLAPAAVLSAVPPIVVKVRLASLSETGAVVGSFSAVGTAGAIFGSLATGFFLVAAFPTRPILFVLGALLVAAGLVLHTARSRNTIVSSVLLVAGIGAGLAFVSGPCDLETAYHCVIVAEDPERESGRTLILDRLHNSYVDLADPTHLEFRYVKIIADAANTHRPAGPLRTVSIGGGGMTLPLYFDATRPGSEHMVLEIDGSVVEVARTQLGVDRDFDVVVDDARISLRSVPDDSADLVVGDAYSGASVPWHLTTVEYTTEIERVLAGAGLYAMNVVDYRDLRFARSAARTLMKVFDHVALFVPPGYLDGRSGGNFVFISSSHPFDAEAMLATIRGRGGAEALIADHALAEFASGGVLLRDDFAPVDQMLIN